MTLHSSLQRLLLLCLLSLPGIVQATPCQEILLGDNVVKYLPFPSENRRTHANDLVASNTLYQHSGNICFTLDNPAPVAHMAAIRLQSPVINHVELLQESGTELQVHAIAGIDYPLDNWSVLGSEILFFVDIPANTAVTYVINAGSVFSFNTHVAAGSRNDILQILSTQRTVAGYLTGIIFALVFYALFLAFTQQEKTYLFLAGSTAGATLLQLSDNGVLYVLWPNATYWNEVCSELFAVGSLICGVELARRYLMTADSNPRIDRLMRGIVIYMLLVGIPIALTANEQMVIAGFALPAIAIMLGLIALSILRIRQHYTPARIYLVALTLPVIAGLVIVSTFLGLLPASPLVVLLPLAGTAVQLVLFAFALGSRINWLGEQQQLLHEQALLAETETRARKNFLAQITHELRTPLAGLIGLAEMAQKKSLYIENRLLIDGLLASARNLLSTTNMLLDHARLDSGKWLVQNEAFSARELLNNIVQDNRAAAARKNLVLSQQIHEPVPERVSGDADIIRRVLQQLLDNAIKFTTAGGILLTAELTRTDGQSTAIRFDVVDTGKGIDGLLDNRIFELFELADTSTTRVQQGLGLGLSLSRKFCELVGGDIGYDSNPHHGTVFWCQFPCQILTAPDLTQAARTPLGKPETRLAKKPGSRILVAEDDDTLQMIISAQLEKLQVNFKVYPNGKPLVEEYKQQHQDIRILLLDWNMPVCNASEAIAAVRQYETMLGLPAVKIAVLSAYDKNSAREMNLPADITLLQKPVNAHDLQQLLSIAPGDDSAISADA